MVAVTANGYDDDSGKRSRIESLGQKNRRILPNNIINAAVPDPLANARNGMVVA